MREKRTVQTCVFEIFAEHEIGQELKVMSDWLDKHLDLLDWVQADIRDRNAETGRKGMSVESVLRCAILKQYRQLSYEDLLFCLEDSVSCQSFARLTAGWIPKKSTLQGCISAISPVTWEQINQCLLSDARSDKVEEGKVIRIDSTVTESNVHEPTDSSLLWDSVRILVRLLEGGKEIPGVVGLLFTDHRRRAKKRMRAIEYTKGADKKAVLYKDLIEVTRKSLRYVEDAVCVVTATATSILDLYAWKSEVGHYTKLILQVIDQTERRVFGKEKVPAGEKIFSLFEEHTDIIIKGGREIQYGHKLNLTTGKSGLVLDVVIEPGNPADSDRLLPMLERHINNYGKAPRQMAADGGYASIENLDEAKACGVEDMVFQKKRGLKVEDMAKSPWVYRKLRNFRAGIEAGISCLKRAYGLARCTWKGLQHFHSYVWSSVVAHNLALFSRLRLA